MTVFEAVVLMFIGGVASVTLLLVGFVLGVVVERKFKPRRTGKRRRVARVVASRASSLVAQPPVDQGVVAGQEVTAAAPVSVAVTNPPAVADPPEQAPPALPLTPPALDQVGEAAVAMHGQALKLWQIGDHRRAQQLLEKSVFSVARLANPWLQMELWSELRKLYCAQRNFNSIMAIDHHLERMREGLPAGAQKESNYITGEKFEDSSWVTKEHLQDVERCSDAFDLYNASGSALQQNNLDESESLAREAVTRARTVVGPNHWISGLMLNALAQAFVAKGDLSAARDTWQQAQAVMSDWMYALPDMQALIAHNLAEVTRIINNGQEM